MMVANSVHNTVGANLPSHCYFGSPANLAQPFVPLTAATLKAADTAALSAVGKAPYQKRIKRLVMDNADNLGLNPKVLAAAFPAGEVGKWSYRGVMITKEFATISKTAGLEATIKDVGVRGLMKQVGPNLAKGYVRSCALGWAIVGGTVALSAGVYQYQHRSAHSPHPTVQKRPTP